MPLEVFAWNSPPLDFSRIPVTILINIIVLIVIMQLLGLDSRKLKKEKKNRNTKKCIIQI